MRDKIYNILVYAIVVPIVLSPFILLSVFMTITFKDWLGHYWLAIPLGIIVSPIITYGIVIIVMFLSGNIKKASNA